MAARVQIPASPLKPVIRKGLRVFLYLSVMDRYRPLFFATTPTTTPKPNKKCPGFPRGGLLVFFLFFVSVFTPFLVVKTEFG